MKNLVLLLVLIPFLAFGQQEFPLIKDGGIWREARATINTPPDPWYIIKFQYLMEGDTTVNATVYKKIYSCDYSPAISNKVFFGGIREDSLGIVFFFLDTNQWLMSNYLIQSNKDYLLYDFSLNIGDTLKVVSEVDSIQILQSIDSVLVDNQYRKRWTFYGSFSQREVIEGIGCTKGLFFPLQYTFEDYQLLTCYEDSNLFWTNPELQGSDCFSVGIEENNHDSYKVIVFPNPATTQINLDLGSKNQIIEMLNIFTITGQKAVGLTNVISSNTIDIHSLKPGIYLLEGVLESGESFVGKFVKE